MSDKAHVVCECGSDQIRLRSGCRACPACQPDKCGDPLEALTRPELKAEIERLRHQAEMDTAEIAMLDEQKQRLVQERGEARAALRAIVYRDPARAGSKGGVVVTAETLVAIAKQALGEDTDE